MNNILIEEKVNSKKMKTYPLRKIRLVRKLEESLSVYDKCVVIDINNIPSKEISKIRKEFNCRLICGKNTLIRKTIKEYIKKSNDKNLLNLLNNIKGNCALLFTKEKEFNNLYQLCKNIENYQCKKAAKIGMISNTNIIIKNGLTNLEASETQFFQSMGISTRIINSRIGLLNDIELIKKNEKMDASKSLLLHKLNKKPFIYNINIIYVYYAGKDYINNQILNKLNINDNKEDITYIELIPFKEEDDDDDNTGSDTDVGGNGGLFADSDDSDSETETESETESESTNDSHSETSDE